MDQIIAGECFDLFGKIAFLEKEKMYQNVPAKKIDSSGRFFFFFTGSEIYIFRKTIRNVSIKKKKL